MLPANFLIKITTKEITRKRHIIFKNDSHWSTKVCSWGRKQTRHAKVTKWNRNVYKKLRRELIKYFETLEWYFNVSDQSLTRPKHIKWKKDFKKHNLKITIWNKCFDKLIIQKKYPAWRRWLIAKLLANIWWTPKIY